MKERQAMVRVTAARYQRAGKKEKKAILDEFTMATHYNRNYASWLLNMHGKRVHVANGLTVVGDVGKQTRRTGKRIYDLKVVEALKKIWAILDWICGKRLAAILPEVVAVLERKGEIHLDKQTRGKLLKISAASIDRLLRPERQRLQIKGRSLTKPGSLLKHQIPIRTYCEWDEDRPGFAEIDLVAHDGGRPKGDYCQTLDLTDIHTCWTETRAVRNKAQVWVFKALKEIRKALPFPLLGIDSDNGGEFINHHLANYCRDEQITFTRARPYRKNDNCFVEQKNYSIVRRAVGYGRYDSPEQLRLLNQLYDRLRLYTNYFQPVVKLQKKERVGSKVKKHYDKAQTPYQRVLLSPAVSAAAKRQLRKQYAELNPAQLKREIEALQSELERSCAAAERSLAKAPLAPKCNASYAEMSESNSDTV